MSHKKKIQTKESVGYAECGSSLQQSINQTTKIGYKATSVQNLEGLSLRDQLAVCTQGT